MEQLVQIRNVLLENGIYPNMKGYAYSYKVLQFMREGDSSMREAYQKISLCYNVKPNTVEKGISNAIEKAFGKSRILARYEKECLKNGKISNKKFFQILIKQVKF